MQRLDQLLVSLHLSPSRTLAQKLIKEQYVEVQQGGVWRLAEKASQKYDPATPIRIRENTLQQYVSRAGHKLAGAFSHTQFRVQGLTALDIGQSTGGFSDCLLQAGAHKVIGVDVGREQLHSSLRENPKVHCIEGLNARELAGHSELQLAANGIDLIVMDLSFISQTLVLPQIALLMKGPFHLFSLVKPQFEVGPEGVGKGGIVKNTALYRDVERLICKQLTELGFTVLDYFNSSIDGGDGNKEFFVHAAKT